MREVKRAGSRKTLNAPNLVALGAERLAAVLMDVAEGDPSLKRRLRMELAVSAACSRWPTNEPPTSASRRPRRT